MTELFRSSTALVLKVKKLSKTLDTSLTVEPALFQLRLIVDRRRDAFGHGPDDPHPGHLSVITELGRRG
jgi:hypothetical protein